MYRSGKVFITGSSVFLPNAPVDNNTIEKVLGMIGGKPSRARAIVLRNNGIQTRYYAIDPETGKPTHTNAQLTAEAVRGLEEIERIDCLVTGTSMPDQFMPNHGVMVHGELGIPPCEVVSTTGICLSGVTALKYAVMSVFAGQARRAVATASELASVLLRANNFEAESEYRVSELEASPEIAFEKDFLRWMLSDGAGALLLEGAPRQNGVSLRVDWIDILSQANSMEACMYAGAEKQEDGTLRSWQTYRPEEWASRSIFAAKQDVRLLNENVVRETFEKPLRTAIARRGLKAADINWFLPHMSSEYFRKPLTECMAAASFVIPPERWFTNLRTHGNTGSASIYIMLNELMHSGQLKDHDRILCFVPESGRFTGSLMQLTAVIHA